MRNRSLTNEEVDAFWRQHGRPESGQGSPLGSPRAAAVSPLPFPRRSEPQQHQESPFADDRRLQGIRSLPSPLARSARSSSSHGGGRHFSVRSEPSSPATTRREGFPENTADSPSTSCDWWTRSSWAFLNAPPPAQEEVIFGGAQTAYTCDQLHAARIVTGNA